MPHNYNIKSTFKFKKMKKLILTAAVALFAFTANAQDESTEAATGSFAKSDLYVSGTVGFTSFSQDEVSTSGFEFSPSVGYFLTDNIALELGLGFGSDTAANDDKTTTVGVDLGARYFFTPASQFSFTVGAGFAYQTETTSFDAGGDDFKFNTFGFAVAPGVNYFVSDAFALRASIGALSYASAKADVDGAEAANTFGLNFDLSDINFGLTYKF